MKHKTPWQGARCQVNTANMSPYLPRVSALHLCSSGGSGGRGVAVWRGLASVAPTPAARLSRVSRGKAEHLLPCSALPLAGATPQRKYTPASCLQKPPRPRLPGTCGKDLPVPRLARGWQCRRDHCWEVRPVARWREGRPGPELVLPLLRGRKQPDTSN